MYKLMIADDESTIRRSLEFALENDYLIFPCDNKKDILYILEKESIDIILLDLRLGSDNGLDILKDIKKVKKETIVIIMTAYGTIESSVQAMKLGAFYYITKPINIEEIHLLLSKVNEYINLNSQVKYLSNQIKDSEAKYKIIGNSKEINRVFDLIDRVKDIDVNILVTGESGTGKDLVANAIHYNGKRKGGAFNAINCSAIPSNLLESELFGHKKGAFTGALEDKKGIIELSQNGTLFLDEIGELDINLQTKLLRVLQDKEIRPVGSNSSIKVDFRFIAATNKNLIEEIQEGNFRQDLFYRINVINIEVPSLRQRREDIAKLIEHFIKKYKSKLEKNIKGITKDALESLEKYKYYGNVRELQNIIERAIVLTEDNYIKKEDLPEEIFQSKNIHREDKDLIPIYIGEDFKAIEKKVIEYNLRYFNGNRRKTAEILKIGERTLRYKIKEYNMK